MLFTYPLGNGYSLALYTTEFAAQMHELIEKNLERLREWEGWAYPEQTLEGVTAFADARLTEWREGGVLPCVVLADADPSTGAAARCAGAVHLKIDSYSLSGELGYWIDADHEGRGVVTAACRALMAHGRELGLQRFEIRAALENTRSAAVAERLGFEREGVHRSAMRVADRRFDSVTYGLIP